MPVRDTLITSKVLQPSDTIVTSLIELRDELSEKYRTTLGVSLDEVVMKINSCLYRTYPSYQKAKEHVETKN
jgi:hypothetical protein